MATTTTMAMMPATGGQRAPDRDGRRATPPAGPDYAENRIHYTVPDTEFTVSSLDGRWREVFCVLRAVGTGHHASVLKVRGTGPDDVQCAVKIFRQPPAWPAAAADNTGAASANDDNGACGDSETSGGSDARRRGPRAAAEEAGEEVEVEEDVHTVFRRECAILARLDHPSIVRLFSALVHPVHPAILMEYADGPNLMGYLQNYPGHRLPERRARVLFSALCEAVAYCHRQGVVHRDLKPENVIVQTSAAATAAMDCSVKLVDFGYATCCGPADRLDTHCGSLTHAAPEVLRRQPFNGFLADCWSLGVILFEMICGRIPFDACTRAELAVQILRYQRIPITVPVSASLRDVIDQRTLVPVAELRSSSNSILNHQWLRCAL